MNKQEYISNKNKCKNPHDIRYVRYIKTASIVVILLVLLYTVSLAQITKRGFAQIISENITITCGFILATHALLTFYVSKGLIREMPSLEYFESDRLKLLLITISGFAAMNYVTGILGVISLAKFYRWKDYYSFSEMLEKARKEKRLHECILLLLMYLVLSGLQWALGSMVLR